MMIQRVHFIYKDVIVIVEDSMAGRNIDEKLRCSFCNKTQDQVKKLIAGHNGAYICDECVGICS